jgi:hypothetical protein
MPEDDNKKFETIAISADLIAEQLLIGFGTMDVDAASSLQLGMVKALAVMWAACSNGDSNEIFHKIMEAMPPLANLKQAGWVQ